MLYVEWANGSSTALDDAAVLTAAITAAGLSAAILRDSLPADLPFGSAFDVARHLADGPVAADDTLLILGAQALDDTRLSALRRVGSKGSARCVAAGRFANLQAEIGVQSKLGYALGREPELFPLPDEETCPLAYAGAPVFGVDRSRPSLAEGPARLLLIEPPLEDGMAYKSLQSLAASRRLSVTILTNGKSKTDLMSRAAPGLAVYHYAEVPLSVLAARADLAVFCAPVAKAYRMRMLLADLAASGVGLLDASAGFGNRRLDPVFVPAPSDLAALASFLIAEILPELRDLKAHVRASGLAARSQQTLVELSAVLALAPAEAKRARQRVEPSPPRVLFVPTNGVGLGHAQRCSLIADDLDRREVEPIFAAFPSCGAMLKSYGFDVMPLVAKTDAHAERLANDVVNYRRLYGIARTCGALVFDGGYVFNSVYRTVLENRLPSAWIRRGLWQPMQDNTLALDREKVFDRVIVPREAFQELNVAYSSGEKIREVGPIVQRTTLTPQKRLELRSRVAERFEHRAERLVVTMLGGGVAADRSAQALALAALMAKRRDVLHLVVVWPTATIDPALFGWSNTRIVKTHHASALVAAADLYVSAAGYNSFHEAMYNAVPTIFVPQMAAYMDDQRARAVAAAERGLSALVEPHALMELGAAVRRMLDGGEAEVIRTRLSGLDLPASGCHAAAQLIAELAGGGERIAPSLAERRIAW